MPGPDGARREGVLTRSRPETRPTVEPPHLWRVLLHNDDYTTQEFVVWVLESVFHKGSAEAVAIMMRVHQAGIGVAGVYTRDAADSKVRAARDLADRHEFPLLVTMEPEPEASRA